MTLADAYGEDYWSGSAGHREFASLGMESFFCGTLKSKFFYLKNSTVSMSLKQVLRTTYTTKNHRE